MTDPNQNSPQNPGEQNQNPYASSDGSGQQGPQGPQNPPWQPGQGDAQQNMYGPAGQQNAYGQQGQPGQNGQQGQPWQPGGPQGYYGQPGQPGQPGPVDPQQNMYGQPGQPGGPGGNGGSGGNGKAVAIIVGVVVVIIVIAAVLVFALRGNDDKKDDTAAQSNTSAPLDDTFTDGGGTSEDSGSGSSGGNGLSPQWAALVPSGIADHLEDCYDTSFNVHYVDEDSGAFEVDGSTCYATGTALDDQQVDILSNDERVSYLKDAVAGNQGASTARVFKQDGSVTVGIANVESTDPTLYYLDSSSDLSVEIMTFTDAESAQAAAQELGIL